MVADASAADNSADSWVVDMRVAADKPVVADKPVEVALVEAR